LLLVDIFSHLLVVVKTILYKFTDFFECHILGGSRRLPVRVLPGSQEAPGPGSGTAKPGSTANQDLRRVNLSQV